MKHTTIKGIHISTLSLGTVQLGLNYGIANCTGKPADETAFAILNHALSRGVTAIDTAAAYGTSEEVIGRWLRSIPAASHPFIMTKVHKLDHSSLSSLRYDLFAQVEESKKRLGVAQIPLLMLHSCDDYLCDADNVKTVFSELKKRGISGFPVFQPILIMIILP